MVIIPTVTGQPDSLIPLEQRAFLLGQKASALQCALDENPYLYVHVRLANKWQEGHTLNNLAKAMQSWL